MIDRFLKKRVQHIIDNHISILILGPMAIRKNHWLPIEVKWTDNDKGVIE